MTNPYMAVTPQGFWKTGVFEQKADIRPVMAKKLIIRPQDKLVTAGSCFAQNVAKHLRDDSNVTFYTTETLRDDDPVFSGRYGNIYTAHQLVQLFDECESGLIDQASAVRRLDGRYVDINRPYMQLAGFDTPAEVIEARGTHIAAVRNMFRDADIFVFTLGLTEAWWSPGSGRVFPVCPGIYSDETDLDFAFRNFSFSEVLSTMDQFVQQLLKVNPTVKVLLTVSPVPLTATYTQDHVLVATMHSKSILRVVCSELTERYQNVFYFPSYEMISNPYTGESAYSPENLRVIKPDAIQKVMAFFASEFLSHSPADAPHMTTLSGGAPDDDIICDDVEIEKSVGF